MLRHKAIKPSDSKSAVPFAKKTNVLKKVLEEPSVQRGFPEQLMIRAQVRLNNPVLIAEYPLADDKELADQGIDTVVEVSGLTIRLVKAGSAIDAVMTVITWTEWYKTSYRLLINAEYRLIDVSDQSVVDQQSFTYSGSSKILSRWDSERFRAVIQEGYRDLPKHVIEKVRNQS